jgi:hypothetical protein
LFNQESNLAQSRLDELKKRGSALSSVTSLLPYLPLSALFDSKGQANEYIFKQVPDGAIIEIVRHHWSLKDKIGTDLDVSHLGFAFWHDGQLWFRNASSLKMQVMEESLAEYLKRTRSVPSIAGINVQILTP